MAKESADLFVDSEIGSDLTVWGDFTCPWSYLAWRRTELLIEAPGGAKIDWRTAEHDSWHQLSAVEVSDRFASLRDEVSAVLAQLLPGEPYPYVLKGHVPFTGAATSAYAEAYAGGVAREVRRKLFEAFWQHGLDLNDARLLRTMLAEDLRGSASPSEPVWKWGLAVDVTGGPISNEAWHLVRDWRSQWGQLGKTVPVVAVGDRAIVGVAAVDWLGDQVRRRGLDTWDDLQREHPAA